MKTRTKPKIGKEEKEKIKNLQELSDSLGRVVVQIINGKEIIIEPKK